MTYNERLKKPVIWEAAPVLFRIVLLTTWGDPNMVLVSSGLGLCLIQSSTGTERADFFSHHFGTAWGETSLVVSYNIVVIVEAGS